MRLKLGAFLMERDKCSYLRLQRVPESLPTRLSLSQRSDDGKDEDED